MCVFWHPSLVRSGQRGAEVLDIVALLHKWMSGCGETRWRAEGRHPGSFTEHTLEIQLKWINLLILLETSFFLGGVIS